MSFYSNHYPEVVEEVHNRVAREEGLECLADQAQQGWPDDWTPLDALYFERWSTTVDLSAPPPKPEDLPEPSGSWFTDDPPKAA
jgi:hypothetical protein